MIRLSSCRSTALVILAGVTVVACGRKPAAEAVTGAANDSSITVTEAQRGQIVDGEGGAAGLRSGHRHDRHGQLQW